MFFSCALLLLFSSIASGHPGKTDYQDGHKCLKNCAEWDLYHDEYHLHDQDRNAIRMEGRKKSVRELRPAKKSGPEPSRQDVAVIPVPVSPGPQTEESRRIVPVDRDYSMPVEEGVVLTLYDFVLFGVAGLLLLAMLFLRRKRER